MPKRKRDDGASVESLFARFRTELYQSLKAAKGFERQRQSKRLRDEKSTPEKKARIEKEVVVLKSLDLRQTAHAHLCSSLLRIKAVAESDKLPDEVKAGVPKPDLTPEEKALLHNVTSSLYNRPVVKRAVEKAIEGICRAIGVPVPEKKGKGKGKDSGEEKERDGSGEGEREKKGDKSSSEEEEQSKKKKKKKKSEEAKDGPESGKAGGVNGTKKEDRKGRIDQKDDEEIDEEEEEKAVSQLDQLLGLESDEENEDEEEEVLVKGRTRKPAAANTELDPMEITTDEEGDDEEEDDDEGGDLDPMEVTSDEEEGGSGDEDEFQGFSDSGQDGPDNSSSEGEDESASDAESSASSIVRSPPAKKVATSEKASKSSKTKPTNSTFLPTLMGGYISGSESASDVDVAPVRKNRRGQRARQKIWEKKYGEKARHLQKQAAKGRDAGWDPKRGAVDGESAKPWKRGIRNPLQDRDKDKPKPKDSGTDAVQTKKQQAPPKREPPKRARDDSGPLHPSWEAKKQAKAKEQLTAPFQGKKITFD